MEPTGAAEKCACGERFVFIRPEKKEEVFLAYKEGGINAVEEVILGGVNKKILYCPNCTKKWDPMAAACVCGHKNIYFDRGRSRFEKEFGTDSLMSKIGVIVFISIFILMVVIGLFKLRKLLLEHSEEAKVILPAVLGILVVCLYNSITWLRILIKGFMSLIGTLMKPLFEIVGVFDGMFGKIIGVFAIIVGILLTLTGLGALVGIPLIAAGCVFYFAGIIGGALTFVVLSYIMNHSQ
jgi:hypothetical protein